MKQPLRKFHNYSLEKYPEESLYEFLKDLQKQLRNVSSLKLIMKFVQEFLKEPFGGIT